MTGNSSSSRRRLTLAHRLLVRLPPLLPRLATTSTISGTPSPRHVSKADGIPEADTAEAHGMTGGRTTEVSRVTSQDPRDLMTGEKQPTGLTPRSSGRVEDTDPIGSRVGETRVRLRTAGTTMARPGGRMVDGTTARTRRKAERAPRRTTARATERALRRTMEKDTARAVANRTGAPGPTTPTVGIRTQVTSRRTTGTRLRATAIGRRRRPGNTERSWCTRSVRCT